MTDASPEVLLVEDNPVDVDLTLRVFHRNGVACPIHVAVDGEEALDFLFAERSQAERRDRPLPQVVFLDLHLPKIGGISVLQSIRADPRTRELAVVALTSSDEEKDILKSYALGVNSYMVKPMDRHKLAAVADELGFAWLRPPSAPA